MSARGWDRLVPDYGDASDPEVRARYGYLEGTVSIVGNVGLFLLKLVLGLLISSIALVADAFHSLSDVATSGVVIVGFRYTKKPADDRHPYGHGRVEYIAALVIAVLLAITGLEFILESVRKLGDPTPFTHPNLALVIAMAVLASAGIKELMARYSSTLAHRIGSDVLDADAWHHRSDAISSVGVAVSIVGSHYGLTVLDPVFGIVVALLIIYVGVRLVRTSSSSLIGEAPDASLVERIGEAARSVNGVEGVHDIDIHDYGARKIITMHAEVRDDLPLEEAHVIADRLDARVEELTSYPTIVHMDPKRTSHGSDVVASTLERLLDSEDGVVSFHRVRVMRHSEGDRVTLHVIVDKDMSVEDSHALCHRLEAQLEARCGPCSVIAHFEPCVRDCEVCSITCAEKAVRRSVPPSG